MSPARAPIDATNISIRDFMTVVSVAQDSRSECRHRAALIPAGGRDTTRGHRCDAHGVKSAALAIFDRSLFVATATADRRRFLGEVWVKRRG